MSVSTDGYSSNPDMSNSELDDEDSMSMCFSVVIFVDVPLLAAVLPLKYVITGWLVYLEVSKAALEGIKKNLPGQLSRSLQHEI